VSRVVHAVAREEIQNAAAVGGEKFGGRAAFVLRIHLKNVKEVDPLRVDVIGIEGIKGWYGGGGRDRSLGCWHSTVDASNWNTVPGEQ